MSKLKSDIIQKIYKESYLCKEGHSISWEGKDYVYSNDIACNKCGQKMKIQLDGDALNVNIFIVLYALI